ncbi:unnamed protein product [Calypogeia fissa]
MDSMAAEELVAAQIQEERCLLPAALLVAERRSNFANRHHGFKLRKCVTNICEAAPVRLKSFVRKRPGKSMKFAELANSPRLGRSGSARSAESNVYDLSTITRRSKILYYAS